MAQHASDNPELGFRLGDHVCAFYNGSTSLDDIVVDYLSQGLRDGHKCFGMVDSPSTVRDRIPADIISREDSLRILTEDEAYMPDGRFSKDAFIGQMKEMVHGAFAEGYERFRAVGDESFIIRNSVDVNGIVITNPHYVPADQLRE